MGKTISVIDGDGIGPEILSASLRVLDALDCGLRYEPVEAGLPALEKHGDLLPEATLASIRRNGVALKGPLTTPVGKGFRSINVALRAAIRDAIGAGDRTTPDLGGTGDTDGFADAIIERIGRG